MEGLAKWLSDISWPIVSRILAALGIGTVTYTGLGTALDSAIMSAQMAVQGILPMVVSIAARAGFFEYFAISSGGITTGLTWMVMKHFALKVGGTS